MEALIEQTQYTAWEAIKMLRMLPFDTLLSNFARSLARVVGSVPIEELKMLDT